MKDMWNDGVLKSTSRCWAQGMDGWRPLHTIHQLKWSLCATGAAILNDTELAVTSLDMLIDICSFYPNRYVDVV